mmetsp:Transcript_54837/g.130760  ORF Transcript_54837/g.130760 Transcript_54837/m.130760 type:complete len:202 (+) Transcript_54837:339-944(+)
MRPRPAPPGRMLQHPSPAVTWSHFQPRRKGAGSPCSLVGHEPVVAEAPPPLRCQSQAPPNPGTLHCLSQQRPRSGRAFPWCSLSISLWWAPPTATAEVSPAVATQLTVPEKHHHRMMARWHPNLGLSCGAMLPRRRHPQTSKASPQAHSCGLRSSRVCRNSLPPAPPCQSALVFDSHLHPTSQLLLPRSLLEVALGLFSGL